MTIFLAIVAGSAWAFTDYAGGLGGRKVGSAALSFYMQIGIFVFVVPLAIATRGHFLSGDFLMGAAGGVFNMAAYFLFIDGLRVRTIAAIVPSSAVVGAVVPAVAGVFLGDALNWLSTSGIALAIIGVAFASSRPSDELAAESRPRSSRRLFADIDRVALFYGVVSGIGFGIMFVLVAQTSSRSGLWPVAGMRLPAPIMYLVLRYRGADLKFTRQTFIWVAVIAAFGAIAQSCYATAARVGPLGVVSTITATSPAGTAAMAHFLGHERISRKQLAGIVFAVAGVIALSIS